MSDINVQPFTAQIQLSSRGPRGPRGPAPEFRINDGVLEWRVIDPKNPQSWAPLVDLSEFLTDSEAAADLARKWAAEDENVVVGDGLYSALHYAAKSLVLANAAAGSASDALQAKIDAESARDAASGHESAASGHADTASSQAGIATGAAQDAADARDKAEEWAEADEDVEVEAGKYSAKHYAAKAAQSAEDAAIFDPSSYYDKTTSDARFVPASHVGAGGDAHAAATTSAAGFMSAADKATLDSISAGFGGKADLDEDGKVPLTQLPLAEDEDAEAGTGTGLVNAGQVGLAIAALAGDVVLETFTASGTFTKEDDDIFYFVEAWGGGGGGSAIWDPNPSTAVRGGNGGDYNFGVVAASEAPATVAVIVGAGGIGGNSTVAGNFAGGGAGGDTSFGEFVLALGGSTSNPPSTSSGDTRYFQGGVSQNGTGTSGSSHHGGGAGAWMFGTPADGTAGTAGTSVRGGDGGAAANPSSVGEARGQDGAVPAGGGGAASTGETKTTSCRGGDGARGEVRVYRFKRIKQ